MAEVLFLPNQFAKKAIEGSRQERQLFAHGSGRVNEHRIKWVKVVSWLQGTRS